MVRFLCLILILAGAAVTEVRFGNRSRTPDVPRDGLVSDDLGKVLLTMAVAGAASQALIWGARVSAPEAFAGGAVSMAGLLLRCMAMSQLRGRFRLSPTVQTDRPYLTTDGCYGRIRHPGYLALILLTLGVCLLAAGVSALAWAVPFALGLASRVQLEERLLASEFGDVYRNYQSAVRWRIVPGIF